MLLRTKITVGSFALVGSIFALWQGYLRTLDTILETNGEVTPEQVATPPVPEPFQDDVQRITAGYEDAYFGPIAAVGEQAADPTAPQRNVPPPQPDN